MSARILLVDDHEIVRDGLRILLRSLPDMQLIAEAEDGRTAVTLARDLNPDVVVMDILMPNLNGIDATRRIGELCPAVKVVILSALTDHKIGVQAMAAGAMGLVSKISAFEELALAIRTVISGKNYLSPRLPPEIAAAIHAIIAPLSSDHLPLSSREREVLQLIAEGKCTKEIAYHLDLSTKTIETHRRQLMEKIGVDNVADLTKYAVREGLISL